MWGFSLSMATMKLDSSVALCMDCLVARFSGGRFFSFDYNPPSANRVQLDVVAPGEVDVAKKILWKVDPELAAAKGANLGSVPSAGPAPVDVSADDPRAFGVEELPTAMAATESREIAHDDPFTVLCPVDRQGVHERQGSLPAYRAGDSLHQPQGGLRLVEGIACPESGR